MKFQLIPRTFIFAKNNTMAILLKTASVRVSSIQIIQVRVQNKGKSVWKSIYVGDVSTYGRGLERLLAHAYGQGSCTWLGRNRETASSTCSWGGNGMRRVHREAMECVVFIGMQRNAWEPTGWVGTEKLCRRLVHGEATDWIGRNASLCLSGANRLGQNSR